MNRRRLAIRATAALVSLVAESVLAGLFIEAGDMALRHDIQRLSDYGVINGPISTWPLAWGPILDDLREADVSRLPPAVADAVVRLRYRGRIETEADIVGYNVEVGLAEKPTRIRSFRDTPRGEKEVSAGIAWLGDWLSVDLNAQWVDGDPQVDEYRADNSMIGVAFGNWSIAASTQERWWGPGWDGSLILANNARPIPALTIDRVFTDAPNSKWLSWIGPWDLSVMFGQSESARAVPNAQFFGMRFNFRPLRSLEIGISRTAQWCGDGRPCGFDTFVDLFLGRDNVGDAGIGAENEPGNQLAGFDFRWAPRWRGSAFAIYGQFIGEDEAGGFPSRYLGLLGGEWSGYLHDRWSARVFAEFAGTACQFYESSKIFNCAYNHSIYKTGYRYRNRSIGHPADNDTELVSVGLILVDADNLQWRALLRYGELNDGGPPDSANTLTTTRQEIASVDIGHTRRLPLGELDAGVGYESIDDAASGSSTSHARFYLRWRHLF